MTGLFVGVSRVGAHAQIQHFLFQRSHFLLKAGVYRNVAAVFAHELFNFVIACNQIIIGVVGVFSHYAVENPLGKYLLVRHALVVVVVLAYGYVAALDRVAELFISRVINQDKFVGQSNAFDIDRNIGRECRLQVAIDFDFVIMFIVVGRDVALI